MTYPFADMAVNLGFLFAFMSSIFYASSCVITKKIAHIDNLVLYASYTFVCFIISGAFSVNDLSLKPNDISLFILIAFIHFLAFQCLILAYRKEDLVKLSPLEYSTVIWSICLGFLIWQHLPSYKEVLGGTFIIIGSIFVKREELKILFTKYFNKLIRD